jgi:drug/metabolite transporter (DMT)-like permease
VVASGVAEVVGFFSYTFGTRHGIAVAAVIASQFAAIAVAFAYFFLGERLTRVQLIGICTILVGVSMLSAVSS